MKLEAHDETPLRWPDGQEHTLIDRRRAMRVWQRPLKFYRERLLRQLEKMGVSEALVSYNPPPSDRLDPGVCVYFSKPMKEDYSWQSALGIDNPAPTIQQINEAFRAKAMVHHPDRVVATGGDVKLYYQMDEHRKRAIAWVEGTHRREHEYCIPCDRFHEPRWNVMGVYKILAALSVLDDLGSPGALERSFRGFRTALPAHAGEWKDVDKAVNA
jgi:hypothetical protein